MAVSTRRYVRHHDYSRLFIALAVLAAVVAIAPIAAALLGYGSRAVTPKTAFASAPSGAYAVLARTESDADVISVAWANNPGAVTEIARIQHLPGFTSTGAVSPDGKKLALVTVDGGSASHPTASLKVIGLESGLVTNAAANVAPGQTPVWSPDDREVIVTRLPGGNESAGSVVLLSAAADGKGEAVLDVRNDVLGLYPVGFEAGGKLVSIAITDAGSIVLLGSASWGQISAGITRDWKLSPDGNQLAFIETLTDGGVRYEARTVSLSGASSASAQSLSAPVSALGAAWNPATGRAAFGVEPAANTVTSASASTESLSAGSTGFDVPLAYSGDGGNLLVTRWSGSSFSAPGKPVLQIVSPAGRVALEGFTRFFGWSER